MSPVKELKSLAVAMIIICPLLAISAYLDANYPRPQFITLLILIMSFALYSLIRTHYLDADVKKKEQLEIDVMNIGKTRLS